MTGTDAYGERVWCSDPSSLAAWDQAWAEFLHFRGDPIARLDEANDGDDQFVMGSVFTATYRVFGGSPTNAPTLLADVSRVRARIAGSPARERGHAAALDKLIAGDFSTAAQMWDDIAAKTHDMAAVRFAHDAYLHVGDAAGRMRSSEAALGSWGEEHAGYGAVLGQHAFALEEVGEFDLAEHHGRSALDIDPDDLWALHALAHVYESTQAHEQAMELLTGTQPRWVKQDLLAAHIWWHLAIRLVAAGRYDDALEVFDQSMPLATTAFRLCDATSLLWRLDLAGVDTGDRFDGLADSWAEVIERHTCAFLDMHAAMVFAVRPEHCGAEPFWRGLAESHEDRNSQNAETFRLVVKPLAAAIRLFGLGCNAEASQALAAVREDLPRIGGSNAQRDIVGLTEAAARELSQKPNGKNP